MRAHTVLLLVATTLLVAGCISGHPRQVYALSEAVDSSVELAAVGTEPELRLRRVLIPDYIDTTDIIMRVGPHQLRESTTGHWSERLSLGMTRAIWADLVERLPLRRITLDQEFETPTSELLIGVDAFDVWPDGHCLLVANWTILDIDHKSAIGSGRGTFAVAAVRGPGGDPALVAGMSDALDELADAIVAVMPASANSAVAAHVGGQ